MASGARSRRANSTPELDPSILNNVERLIFAQAVHEFGSNAWQEVAKLLSKHPLISQPKGVFTPQSCQALYKHLMEEAGLEWSETETAPRQERHLRLAQKYYVARVTELRALIAAEETKFKQLVTEIDEIRSGAWDDKIRASLGVQEPEKQEVVPEKPATPPAEPAAAVQPAEVVAETVEAEEPIAPPEEPISIQQEDIPLQHIVETAPVVDDADEKEEGSDNEAVNELIGHYESDKPTGDGQDETPATPEAPPAEAEPQEDEMQVDEEPRKEEEEEAEEQSAEVSMGSPRPEPDVQEVQEEPQEGPPEPEDQHESPTTRPSSQGSSEASKAQEMENAPTPEAGRSTRVESKRKASEPDSIEGQRDKKRPREDSELGDEEDGTYSHPSPATPDTTSTSMTGALKTRRKERAGDKRFQNMIGMLHSQISQHRYGNIFHNPIKKSEAPDYHDIVKRPMDLKTIKARVKDGLISNSLEFQRDIFLVFANAMMYNRPGSEIYNMAEEMMTSSEREINAFRQTEGFHRM